VYKEVRVLTALAKGSHSKPLYLFLWDGKNAWRLKGLEASSHVVMVISDDKKQSLAHYSSVIHFSASIKLFLII
jgi:hypothetical protein